VIARGNERKAIFRDERDHQEYLDRLNGYRKRFHFSLYAYCLMTNHVHLAIEEGDVRLSRIMHALQSSYTLWFNRRHSRVGHLFQGRFKSYLVDRDEYLLALVRYIHENPVRAGMVARPQEYRWSSDRYFRTGRSPGWFDLDGVLAMIGSTRAVAVSRYRRLMGTPTEKPYEDVAAVEGVVKGREEFARRALGPPRRLAHPRIGWTADRISRCVAEEIGVSFDALRKPGKRHPVSKARIVAAYLGREMFAMPIAEFARLFRRESSGLVHGVLDLERRIARDPAESRRIETMERILAKIAGLHA